MINKYLLAGIEEVSKREFMRITLTSDDCKEILNLIDNLKDTTTTLMWYIEKVKILEFKLKDLKGKDNG